MQGDFLQYLREVTNNNQNNDENATISLSKQQSAELRYNNQQHRSVETTISHALGVGSPPWLQSLW